MYHCIKLEEQAETNKETEILPETTTVSKSVN